MRILSFVISALLLTLGTVAPALNSSDQALLSANGRNYVANGGAEKGRSGWITYADAAGTSPVDCTGGSPSSTWTTSATTPLSGSYSFVWTHSANNRQGEGASYAFTVDKSDQARVQNISFDYEVASGTFVAGVVPIGGATAVDSDLEVYVYDVTNAAVIQPSNYKLLGGSGSQQRFVGTFQTASNSQSYRLCLHAATTSATAHMLRLDSVRVGPQVTTTGPPVTDWTAYTPASIGAGWGTPAAKDFYWARVGDSIVIKGDITAGTVAASSGAISLPSGVTIDATKLANISVVAPVARSGTGGAMSVVLADGKVSDANTQVLTFGRQDGSTVGLASANISSILSNGERVSFVTGHIPVQGWASNVAMGSDADGRAVVVRASGDPASATTTNPIIFPTVDFDTHGAYSASTGLFTAPVPGFYQVSGFAVTASAADQLHVYVNSSSVVRVANTDSNGECAFSTVVRANAGDTISLRPVSSTVDMSTGSSLSIARVSGSAQIASADSVNARYYASATSLSGSLATVVWTTKDFDTHGAVSSGVFTCPVAGKYHVDSAIAFTASSSAAGNALDVQLQKNGTVVSELAPVYQTTQTVLPVLISDDLSCVAGDTIRIQASSAANTPSITSSNSKNYFSVHRVGN